MRDDDQVEALLSVWLEANRVDTSTPGDMVPFERDALTVMRQVSQGRPGILLNRANELYGDLSGVPWTAILQVPLRAGIMSGMWSAILRWGVVGAVMLMLVAAAVVGNGRHEMGGP